MSHETPIPVHERVALARRAQASADRFWSKVSASGPDDCWEWTASLAWNGYGRFGIGRKVYTAPRVAFAIASGRWAAQCVCHTCDNRKCVNPAHLYEASQGDNLRDMTRKGRHWRKSRDVCDRGHSLADAYVHINKKTGWVGRSCRECRKMREASGRYAPRSHYRRARD